MKNNREASRRKRGRTRRHEAETDDSDDSDDSLSQQTQRSRSQKRSSSGKISKKGILYAVADATSQKSNDQKKSEDARENAAALTCVRRTLRLIRSCHSCSRRHLMKRVRSRRQADDTVHAAVLGAAVQRLESVEPVAARSRRQASGTVRAAVLGVIITEGTEAGRPLPKRS